MSPGLQSVWLVAIAAALLSTGCGTAYHRIGKTSQAVTLQDTLPTGPAHPTRAPHADRPGSVLPTAYFPLNEGQVFRYSRSYGLPAGIVGYRTMTVSGVKIVGLETEAALACRLEGKNPQEKGTPLAMTGHVVASVLGVTADVADYSNVDTLASFALQAPLTRGQTWESQARGQTWIHVARHLEHVTVPAGDFDCLPIEKTCRSGTLGAWRQVQQTLYFASGVGLVKLQVRIDEQHSNQATSRELTEELLSR